MKLLKDLKIGDFVWCIWNNNIIIYKVYWVNLTRIYLYSILGGKYYNSIFIHPENNYKSKVVQLNGSYYFNESEFLEDYEKV